MFRTTCATLGVIAVFTIARADWVTATIPAGAGAGSVAVNPVTNKIYAANYRTNTVTIIDGATDSTVTITVGRRPTSAP